MRAVTNYVNSVMSRIDELTGHVFAELRADSGSLFTLVNINAGFSIGIQLETRITFTFVAATDKRI